MEYDKVIDKIDSLSYVSNYEKSDLIKSVVRSQTVDVTQLEIEKYKIDKMIENGQIKDTGFRQKTIMAILSDAKFRLAYIATLSFLLMALNSCQYWKFQFATLK